MPKKMTILHSLDHIPQFDSDAEASKYWDTHTYSSELLATSVRGPDPELAAILNRKAPPQAADPKAKLVKPKAVKLEAEVASRLEQQAQKSGQSLDAVVNATLKKALKIA
jgi:predicted HicB family RNase H-like nuclease